MSRMRAALREDTAGGVYLAELAASGNEEAASMARAEFMINDYFARRNNGQSG